MTRLPPIKMNSMLYHVLCRPDGRVTWVDKTRDGCEMWFRAKHSMVVITDREQTICRRLMAELGWTIRQVELKAVPTGIVFPTVPPKRRKK